MGKFKLLIIDDEMGTSKGYTDIESVFPGVFDIVHSLHYEEYSRSGPDYPAARELLKLVAFDVILLDHSLARYMDESDRLPDGEFRLLMQGPEIASDIRSNQEFLASNRGAYLIGVSMNWEETNRRTVARRLKRLGIDRGLDAAVATGVPEDLFQALKAFLATRA